MKWGRKDIGKWLKRYKEKKISRNDKNPTNSIIFSHHHHY
jgi:hypothetical protein